MGARLVGGRGAETVCIKRLQGRYQDSANSNALGEHASCDMRQ